MMSLGTETAKIDAHVLVFQSYMFLISSDYERVEWKEMIREQQKKCR